MERIVILAKTKVKKDSHGLYVRGGGYLWRPIYPRNVEQLETLHKENDEVNVNHYTAGPYAKVGTKGNIELWYSHGSYLDFKGVKTKTINSEFLFKPPYEQWF